MNANMSDHLASIREYGYTVLPSLISLDRCRNYKNILEKNVESYSSLHYRPLNTSQHGLDDKSSEEIVYNLHNKDMAFYEMLGHPSVLPIIKASLQEGSYQNSEKVIFTLSTARSPLRTRTGQQLHVDARMPGTPYAMNMIALWMLEDFTIESGATRLVPGSHRRPSFPMNGVSYPDEVSVCAPAGSVLVYNGATWHGGGPKTTDASRWACLFTYARWFLKPSFDFNQNMPKSIYEQLNNEMKDLLGYKVNPPKDEFTRISSRSETFEAPNDYQLPIIPIK
jgi:ectoine hydroxylase-related dioxygenase (phytanoyl-CoA dioxygenase family)